MDAAPTVVPEPGHARPEGTVPDRAGARRAPAAPARAAAARPGPMGAGRRPRTERVPGGGARRPPALGAYHALRQRLREWLLDGADKACPCAAQVDVERCFAPLLRRGLGWWEGGELAPAGGPAPHRGGAGGPVGRVVYPRAALPLAPGGRAR